MDTRPAEAMLLRELDGMRQDLRDHRAEIGVRLDDIVTEARATNGRLRRAELWMAGMRAIAAAAVLLIPFAVAILTKQL